MGSVRPERNFQFEHQRCHPNTDCTIAKITSVTGIYESRSVICKLINKIISQQIKRVWGHKLG